MTRRGRWTCVARAALLLPVFLLAAGCHSYHVDCTIENQTGAVVNLLEVDYPSASFGVDSLAAGAVYHYRFDLQADGPLEIEYTDNNRHPVHITGPNMLLRQQGRLRIVLLPGGKAQFYPHLTPPS